MEGHYGKINKPLISKKGTDLLASLGAIDFLSKFLLPQEAFVIHL
jgi:hypothetical protein